MVALWLALALAGPPEAGGDAPEAGPDAAEPAEAEEVEEPVATEFHVAPLRFQAVRDPVVPELAFQTCAAMAPPVPRVGRANPPVGQVVFQLRFRKGEVAAVTVTHVDPAVDWATPCLKRELAAVRWEIPRGRVEVPVEVRVAEPPARE